MFKLDASTVPLVFGLVPILIYFVKNRNKVQELKDDTSLQKIVQLYLGGVETVGGVFAFVHVLYNDFPNFKLYFAVGSLSLTWLGIKTIWDNLEAKSKEDKLRDLIRSNGDIAKILAEGGRIT